MAQKDYDIVRGTFAAIEKGERVKKGPGATIRLPEEDAARFVDLGHLLPAGSAPRGRAKSQELRAAEHETRQMQEALAQAQKDVADAQDEAASHELVINLLAETYPDEVAAAREAIAAQLAADAGEVKD